MAIVRHLLEKKGYDVYSVDMDALILEALVLMKEKNIGAVPVMHENRVEGIFSERDWARWSAETLDDGDSFDKHTLRVDKLMTITVTTVELSQTVEECALIMKEQRVRHLPVVEDGSLIGIISIGDVTSCQNDQLATLVSQLEGYIAQG